MEIIGAPLPAPEFSSQLTKMERHGYIRRMGTRVNPESGRAQGVWQLM